MVRDNKFWARVFTFVATPTKDDGEAIDEARLRQTIDFQIAAGVDGICVLGSTGGNGSFSEDEMKAVMAIAARHADGRIAVIAGAGARTTSSCIALSKHAQDVGCDGIMVLPVSYWPLTEDEVYDHYSRVAAAVTIPICVYNNPWTTGVDMKPAFLARLAEIDNVDGIKESTGDLTRITAIRLLTKDAVTLIAGWESSSLQAFMAGASGWAPVCTNFLPGVAMDFFRSAVHRRHATEAAALWDRLFPVCDFICSKSHIRVAHTGLDILGRPVGPPRRPMRLLNAEDRARLDRVLDQAGASRG
ncbi:dihydrodipicolinate synthase family protein [Reyranella sp. CPCC 100927]|uniref:dihydrodipicolinate synthase family protein n=1 Tax=Reyranella sp. CPCC 100927 TaxID=2599616 RepID=UPI0015B3B10F|nr:dihydrodipicolinate synthase family protein [Reyranella sp. CPCC 100927]